MICQFGVVRKTGFHKVLWISALEGSPPIVRRSPVPAGLVRIRSILPATSVAGFRMRRFAASLRAGFRSWRSEPVLYSFGPSVVGGGAESWRLSLAVSGARAGAPDRSPLRGRLISPFSPPTPRGVRPSCGRFAPGTPGMSSSGLLDPRSKIETSGAKSPVTKERLFRSRCRPCATPEASFSAHCKARPECSEKAPAGAGAFVELRTD
jgi:hypothetical protein